MQMMKKNDFDCMFLTSAQLIPFSVIKFKQTIGL